MTFPSTPIPTVLGSALAPNRVDAALLRIAEAAAAVFAPTPIFLAYAYGSRVWGVPRSESDLDIGYYCLPREGERSLPLGVELRLAGELAAALGCEVDLRWMGGAPLEMRGRLLEEGRRIYCSDELARVNLERDLLGEYHDYKPKLAEWRRLRLAAAAAR